MSVMINAFKEIARNGVEQVKHEGLQMSAEDVRKFSDTIQNAENGIKFQPQEMKIALERRPSQVCKDVIRRFMEPDSNISPEKWKACNMVEREKMLNEAANIIADELQIPHYELKIMDERKSCRGRTSSFLAKNDAGELVLSDSVKPTVSINRFMLEKDSFFDPLSTLFHESLHVMQQYACTEKGNTVLELPQRELWRKETLDVLDKKIKGLDTEGYFTSAVEEYAHAYGDFLVKFYKERLIDQSLDLRMRDLRNLNREAGALPSPGDGCNRLDIIARSMHEDKLRGEGFRNLNRETKSVLSPDTCTRLDIIAYSPSAVSFEGGPGRPEYRHPDPQGGRRPDPRGGRRPDPRRYSTPAVSFEGGLSASQGIRMIANRKTNEAKRLFQKASGLRSDGLHKKAGAVENEARNVMNEAKNFHNQANKAEIRAERERQRHRAEAEARVARAKAYRQAKEAEQARIKAMRIAEEKAKAKAKAGR